AGQAGVPRDLAALPRVLEDLLRVLGEDGGVLVDRDDRMVGHERRDTSLLGVGERDELLGDPIDLLREREGAVVVRSEVLEGAVAGIALPRRHVRAPASGLASVDASADAQPLDRALAVPQEL